VSRKRGKKPKATVESIPDDVLAEGSGPVRSATAAQADAIATVEDVVTTADIATSDDVVTADDVVATAVEPASASGEPSPKNRPIRAAEEALQETEDIAAPTATPQHDAIAIASTQGLDLSGGGNGDDDRRGGGDDDRARYAAHRGADDGEGDGDGFARSGSDDADADQGYAAYGGSDDRNGSGDRNGNGNGSGNGSYGGDGDDSGDGDSGDGDSDDGNGDSSDGNGDGDDDDAAIVFPTSAASMDAVQLKRLVEALIFASDRPLTVQRLRQLTRVSEVRRLEQALTELAEDYRERGLVLQQVSGGYQFRTRTQFSPWVQQLIAGRPVRLSRAQLETLAIIAYRQPITRPEIDDIRGVDSSATLKLLIDRMLIRVLGKREEVGRPILYGTTKEFLDFFSLGDLRELPTLREYSELTAESRKVMSDRLGIEPDGVDAAGLGTHGHAAPHARSSRGSSDDESHSPSNGESHSPPNGATDSASHGASNGTSNGHSNGHSNGLEHAAANAPDDVADLDELVARTDDSMVFDDDDSSASERAHHIETASDDIEPVSGDIDIETAPADIEAASGGVDIETAANDIEAASGDVDTEPASDDIAVASGDIDEASGDIDKASGDIDEAPGDIDEASGALEAAAGVDADVADIEARLDGDAAAPTRRHEPDAE
jgi:segregation and condensation protein B